MRRTADLPTFLDDPVGLALIGPTWVYFCPRPELFGFALWGRPGAHDMEALVRALKVELGPRIVPHRSLVDASRLEGADAGAFEVVRRYVTDHSAALSRAVTRLALVRPTGMAGALIAGFYEVLERRPYPVSVFAESGPALAWLDASPELGDDLDRLVQEVTSTSTELQQLRTILASDLRDATLATTARRMAVSERTLQRRLRDEGTTFGAELLAARLREARRRMLDTDGSLTVIAYESGFSSPQHLSAAFRAAFGERPSDWRVRHR